MVSDCVVGVMGQVHSGNVQAVSFFKWHCLLTFSGLLVVSQHLIEKGCSLRCKRVQFWACPGASSGLASGPIEYIK